MSLDLSLSSRCGTTTLRDVTLALGYPLQCPLWPLRIWSHCNYPGLTSLEWNMGIRGALPVGTESSVVLEPLSVIAEPQSLIYPAESRHYALRLESQD